MLYDKILELSDKLKKNHKFISNFETTKSSLVMPFIKSLGYDVFNPREVIQNYKLRQSASNTSIDFCILDKQGEVLVFIMCEHWEHNLDSIDRNLESFFKVKIGKIAVITNGILYRFYLYLNNSDTSEVVSFLELDIAKPNEGVVNLLSVMTKKLFNMETITKLHVGLKNQRKKMAEQSANNTVIHKKTIFVYVREDISTSITWSLREDFFSVLSIVKFTTLNDLTLSIGTKEYDMLIIDECSFDSIDTFLDFLNNIGSLLCSHKKKVKVLVILASSPNKATIEQLLDRCSNIADIISRPFTIKRFHNYLFKEFAIARAVNIKTKYITAKNLKAAMVAAENIYIPKTADLLIECGTVLDKEHIDILLKHKVEKIKVHKNATHYINCWEATKCQQFNDCPAYNFVNADGFLKGINGGRACMYLKNTAGECYCKANTFKEKVEQLCYKCKFYIMVNDANNGQLPPITSLTEHINRIIKTHRELMDNTEKR